MRARILHVVHGYPPEAAGGTELHVRDLASAQTRDDHVGVFARVARPECSDLALLPAEEREGVTLFPFNHLLARGRSFLERVDLASADCAFSRVLELFRPDAVHVHHLAHLSAGIPQLAKKAGSRVVLSVHDHALACPRGQRIRPDLEACPTLDRARCIRCVRPAWIQAARDPERLRGLIGLFRPGEHERLFRVRDATVRRALDAVDVFIAPSASAAGLFLEFHPASSGRLRVLPWGVPGTEGTGAYREAREVSAVLRAGYFGSLLPSKGVRLLAEVAARLDPRRAAITLHGAGAAEERERLGRTSAGRLRITGRYARADLPRLMAQTDVVVAPSLWAETFGLVIREAWQHRKPVLASRIGAFVEAAGTGGERVMLLPPGDVAAWTDAIEQLADDREALARLAGPFAPEPLGALVEALDDCYRVPAEGARSTR